MLYRSLQYAIAAVWFINGFFCKVLNLVPRHRLIVSRILGAEVAALATIVIGTLEIFMTIWILSQVKSRWCALTQAVIILTMNTLEFILVPDLLLFGQGNAVLAVFLIAVILLNEFSVKQPSLKNNLAT